MEPAGHHHKTEPNRIKGMSYVLISWIFFTLVIALSKFASAKSSVPTVLLFQNFISLLFVTPWILKRGKKSLVLTKRGLMGVRSLMGYVSYAFIFLAVQRIPLVEVILLSNSAPLFIPIIIWIWKRARINKGLWLGIIIGFIGIGFILRPSCTNLNVGILFALGSAICLSISMIAQRRLVKRESIPTLLFYYFLISTILSIPFTIETWKPLDQSTWILLASIGIFFVIGQFLFLRSFKYEKPSFLSSFNYSAVVYGVIIDWILWKRFPDWCTIIGIVIVCTGGIITILQGKGKAFNPPGNGQSPD